jgi:hypothetical protein
MDNMQTVNQLLSEIPVLNMTALCPNKSLFGLFKPSVTSVEMGDSILKVHFKLETVDLTPKLDIPDVSRPQDLFYEELDASGKHSSVKMRGYTMMEVLRNRIRMFQIIPPLQIN